MEEVTKAQKIGPNGRKSMIRDAQAILLHFKLKILSWMNSNYAAKQGLNANFALLVDLFGLINKEVCWDSGTISSIVEESSAVKISGNIRLIQIKFLFAAWILVFLSKK